MRRGLVAARSLSPQIQPFFLINAVSTLVIVAPTFHVATALECAQSHSVPASRRSLSGVAARRDRRADGPHTDRRCDAKIPSHRRDVPRRDTPSTACSPTVCVAGTSELFF